MKFAIVETEKREALHSGERGGCICCGSETIAHCGNFMVHHWKHKKLVECDNWYEGETEWHRDWKNRFPVHFQEIVKYDLITLTSLVMMEGNKSVIDTYCNFEKQDGSFKAVRYPDFIETFLVFLNDYELIKFNN